MFKPMASMIACLIILSMVVVAPHHAQALTCGQVVQNVLPCLGYLKNGGAITPVCCNGVRTLNSTARTTPDRRLACACLKQAAQVYGITNYGFADALPDKCGVNLGIRISPSVDCSRVN